MSVIVVGVEGSPDSLAALRWAVEEARVRDAVLRVVHAYYTSAGPVIARQVAADAQRTLDEAVAAVDARGVRVEAELAPGRSAIEALMAAGEEADLLVLGSRGMGRLAGMLLGSVSSALVAHAPCPVVVVPLPALAPTAA